MALSQIWPLILILYYAGKPYLPSDCGKSPFFAPWKNNPWYLGWQMSRPDWYVPRFTPLWRLKVVIVMSWHSRHWWIFSSYQSSNQRDSHTDLHAIYSSILMWIFSRKQISLSPFLWFDLGPIHFCLAKNLRIREREISLSYCSRLFSSVSSSKVFSVIFTAFWLSYLL